MRKFTISTLYFLSLMFVACASEAQTASDSPQGREEPLENDGELLTFQNDILPIIQNRCSLCHNETSGLPNWEDYEVTFDSADLVRERVFVTQDMPRGNATGMTDEEREMMALWIDQGAAFE